MEPHDQGQDDRDDAGEPSPAAGGIDDGEDRRHRLDAEGVSDRGEILDRSGVDYVGDQ